MLGQKQSQVRYSAQRCGVAAHAYYLDLYPVLTLEMQASNGTRQISLLSGGYFVINGLSLQSSHE